MAVIQFLALLRPMAAGEAAATRLGVQSPVHPVAQVEVDSGAVLLAVRQHQVRVMLVEQDLVGVVHHLPPGAEGGLVRLAKLDKQLLAVLGVMG